MTIERREFLELIGVAASSASLRSVEWIADDDRYMNETLGLSFRRPTGWHFVTRLDYALLRDRYKLPGGEEVKDRMLALAAKPLVALSAQSPHEPGASPTIVIWVQDDDPGANVEPAIAHRITYGMCGRELNDFAWDEFPAMGSFAGFQASCCVIRWTEMFEGGPPVRVRMKSHMLRNGAHWYTFNFVDTIDGWGPTVIEVFDRFERTISFA